jgi:hypothetical protein
MSWIPGILIVVCLGWIWWDVAHTEVMPDEEEELDESENFYN